MTVGRIPVIEGGIQPTIFDAKADLLTATANDTPARLAVGTNGQVLTADSTAGTGLAWATPASGSTFVGCDLRKTANQTISNNSVTKITFDSENYDTNGFHDNSTNNTRITIPTGYGGKYMFTFIASWENNSTGWRSIIFYVNGSEAENVSRLNNSGTIMVANASLCLNLNAGDYVEFAGYQNSGGTISINAGTASQNLAATRFSCTYLGA
jgi:hypothetical protein